MDHLLHGTAGHMAPTQELWCQVLILAIEDLRIKPTATRYTLDDFQDTLAWFFNPEEAAEFSEVCALANVDLDWVRDLANKVIKADEFVAEKVSYMKAIGFPISATARMEQYREDLALKGDAGAIAWLKRKMNGSEGAFVPNKTPLAAVG